MGRREEQEWGWRLCVLRTMWLPASPRYREEEPWGSFEAEAM